MSDDAEVTVTVKIDAKGRIVVPKDPRESGLGIEGGELVEATVRVLRRPGDGGDTS